MKILSAFSLNMCPAPTMWGQTRGMTAEIRQLPSPGSSSATSWLDQVQPASGSWFPGEPVYRRVRADLEWHIGHPGTARLLSRMLYGDDDKIPVDRGEVILTPGEEVLILQVGRRLNPGEEVATPDLVGWLVKILPLGEIGRLQRELELANS